MQLQNKNNENMLISMKAELAVALIQNPRRHLFGTYRRKAIPNNLQIKTPSTVNCNDEQCILASLKRIIKDGECPKAGCLIDDKELIYRNE